VLLTTVVTDEDVRCGFVEDRLDDPAAVVFGVGVVGATVDVTEVVNEGINGAVVAGGATTFPLLRLTAPKADVREVSAELVGVGVVAEATLGFA
jgi:hypothetical protein